MSTATEAVSPAPCLGPPGRMLIEGQCVEARYGRTLEVDDPALGEVIDHVPAGAAEDIDSAGTAARRALDDAATSSRPWGREMGEGMISQYTETKAVCIGL